MALLYDVTSRFIATLFVLLYSTYGTFGVSSILSDPNEWKSPQWILVHYHKTGHDLVKALTEVLMIHVKASAYKNVPGTGRNDIFSSIQFFDKDIIQLHTPDLPFDWNTAFISHPRYSFEI